MKNKFKRFRDDITLYFWFIKESQSYMQGYTPIWVFVLSLKKGFWFVKQMNKEVRSK